MSEHFEGRLETGSESERGYRGLTGTLLEEGVLGRTHAQYLKEADGGY